MAALNSEQRNFWQSKGFLRIPSFFAQNEFNSLCQWVDEVVAWPETKGKWMRYYESIANEKKLCRIENFIDFHVPIEKFLKQERIMHLLCEVMGEEAILFKEKINFKYPGGAGFAFHQDAPAFSTFKQTYHVTMLLPLGASDTQNGCLYVADVPRQTKLLPQKSDGTLTDAYIQSVEWLPLETSPGDVIFFDSYLPHGSHSNTAKRARPAMYITYNRKSEGDYRLDYFAHKRKYFPPEIEREVGVDYSKHSETYNLGNPIK